jgi:UDP-glucuronate decarboxylase
MKRILVTGGAGFIGSHLCKKLLEGQNSVICLDNLFTGSYHNVEPLMSNQNFRFVRHDVTEEFWSDVDEIYNLACPASPKHYQFDPVKTIRTSVLGVTNMLELAKQSGAKILQASTSEIYGDPLVHPQDENYWGNVNPIGIRSCYDEGKRCAETIMSDYHRQFGVDIKIVRIFNTYGPNMAKNDGRVVSNFIIQALNNEDITIYGNGSQTRSFCYVDDLTDGLISLMETDYNKPVNIGNPDERTILELAQKIIKLTNSTSKIIFKELPSDDPIRRKPNITLAQNLLNWKPSTNIDDGLQKTIDYFKML